MSLTGAKLLGCLAASLAVAACIALALQHRELRADQEEARADMARARFDLRQAELSARAVSAANPSTVFPSFHSADTIRLFASVAEESALHLDEVNYQLTELPGKRHLRYKASATVATDYAGLRNFVRNLRSAVGNAAIDHIACRRRVGVLGAPLACELAVSMFFALPHAQPK